jgi:hypothetical protein
MRRGGSFGARLDTLAVGQQEELQYSSFDKLFPNEPLSLSQRSLDRSRQRKRIGGCYILAPPRSPPETRLTPSERKPYCTMSLINSPRLRIPALA